MGITQPTEEYFKDGTWGWDGTRWRKLPLVFGYSDRYVEWPYNTSLPAGVSNVSASHVPAGEVWRVEGLSVMVGSATCVEFRVNMDAGGVGLTLASQMAPVSGQRYFFPLRVVLKAGDYMYVRFYGMTLNDDAWWSIWGYKMEIT